MAISEIQRFTAIPADDNSYTFGTEPNASNPFQAGATETATRDAIRAGGGPLAAINLDSFVSVAPTANPGTAEVQKVTVGEGDNAPYTFGDSDPWHPSQPEADIQVAIRAGGGVLAGVTVESVINDVTRTNLGLFGTGDQFSASDEEPGDGPENVVDNNTATAWTSGEVADGSGNINTVLTYDNLTPITLQGYSIQANFPSVYSPPYEWLFEGSEDGIDWVTIHEGGSMSWTGSYPGLSYNISNAREYRYYRWVFTKAEPGSQLSIVGVTLNRVTDIDAEVTVTWPAPADIATQAVSGTGASVLIIEEGVAPHFNLDGEIDFFVVFPDTLGDIPLQDCTGTNGEVTPFQDGELDSSSSSSEPPPTSSGTEPPPTSSSSGPCVGEDSIVASGAVTDTRIYYNVPLLLTDTASSLQARLRASKTERNNVSVSGSLAPGSGGGWEEFLIVSGAGTPAVNGLYEWGYSDYLGGDAWVHTDYPAGDVIIYGDPGTGWTLFYQWDNFYGTEASANPTLGTWTEYSGSAPGPTVSSGNPYSGAFTVLDPDNVLPRIKGALGYGWTGATVEDCGITDPCEDLKLDEAILWLHGDDLGADGDPVSKLYDRTPHNNHSTSGEGEVVVDGESKKALWLNGPTQYFSFLALPYAEYPDLTIFFKVKKHGYNPNGFNINVIWSQDSGGGGRRSFGWNNVNAFRIQAGDGGAFGEVPTERFLYAVEFFDTTTNININDGEQTQSYLPNTTPSEYPLIIGNGYLGDGGQPADVYIYEVVVFPRQLTTDEYELVTSCLMADIGVPSSSSGTEPPPTSSSSEPTPTSSSSSSEPPPTSSSSSSSSGSGPTGAVIITEPLDGATINGDRWLVAHITDSDGATTNQRFLIDGQYLPAPSLAPGGTAQDGLWRFRWDTREWLQGPVVFRAEALGSDGELVFDEVTLTLANTIANNILLLETGILASSDGRGYDKIVTGIETPELSPFATRRWWARAGLRYWQDDGADPITAYPTTPEEAVAQMDTHLPVKLSAPKVIPATGYRGERRESHGFARLSPPHTHVIARYFLEAEELRLAWKLAPSTELYKARESSASDNAPMLIFGRNTATVWSFDGETPSLIMNLATRGSGDAIDAAHLGDKVVAIRANGEVWLLDKDAGELPWRITFAALDGTPEPRPARFVEAIGSSFYVFCIDGALAPKTAVYRLTGTNLVPLFTMPGAVSLVDVSKEGIIGMAVGPELWASNAGAAPILSRTFASNITALEKYRVGLESGAIWIYGSSGWENEGTLMADGSPVAVGAVSSWSARAAEPLGVAIGAGELRLWEEGDNGTWAPGRLVENPAATADEVAEVLALRRKATVEQIPEDELTGTPGEPTTRERDSLLLLTAEDGLLLMYYASQLSEAGGACLVSRFSMVYVAPGGAKRPVPVEI